MTWAPPSQIPKFFEKNVPLNTVTYFQLGGFAKFFARPNSLTDLMETLHFALETQLPIVVLGSGSNSIYSDEGFDGVVISMQDLNKSKWISQNRLFCFGGVSNTEVAELCLEQNRLGAQWMYRMPGQIGASVRMNARCFQGEMSQISEFIGTMTFDGQLNVYAAQDIFKGYKSTSLMNKPEIVVWTVFHFPEESSFDALLTQMQDCERQRHDKHHFDFPSCGSTFKNNYSIGKPSGVIFDALGFKKQTVGRATVSEFHANFIFNLGGAKTLDVLELASRMRMSALKNCEAKLELEVQPIGVFPTHSFVSCGMEDLGAYKKIDSEAVFTGFQWDPIVNNDQPKSTKISLPIRLLEFPFTPYGELKLSKAQKNILEEGIIWSRLDQLVLKSVAKSNPHLGFIKWTLSHPNLRRILKPEHKISKDSASFNQHDIQACDFSEFKDELWHNSVAEIFWAHPQHPHFYLEYELAESGQSLALTFDGIRKRTPNIPQKSAIPWQFITFAIEATQVEVVFPYSVLKPYIFGNKIRVQTMLSLPTLGLWQAPFQNLCSIETPNFHQPNNFINLDVK